MIATNENFGAVCARIAKARSIIESLEGIPADLTGVLRAVEWWQSGDTSREAATQAVEDCDADISITDIIYADLPR
jgi:hypothetical protein